ncbi:MAG: serine hydrolase [Verrucomicrobia bacterium]|nr:serine hydrolase [Verrucomicrobiota bacterium]
MKLLRRPLLLLLTLSLCAIPSIRAQTYAPPRFTDPDRQKKIEALLPEISKIYADYAAEKHAPGVVWGIVLDGRLIHTGTIGLANVEKKIPVAANTGFRIASMSKSFTAMAILKLRDAGKLSLDDAVEKYVPESRAVKPLTADAPKITVRHLLGMAAGFPEDNPWGDRQLGITDAQFDEFLARGISLSNAPGVAYEYSNLNFALLGRIVSRVSGEPYQRYITREILVPLGMKDTRWDYTAVPPARLALGYRWEDNTWKPERLEPDGVYGAMGGLITSAEDFAHYIAFHLSAWPPRDDADTGPVRRATVREMLVPVELIGINTLNKTLAGEPNPNAIGYGFGLISGVDSKGVAFSRHSGGLPGFGSEYRFFPEYGFGVFSFANVTYAGTAPANTKVATLVIEKAGLAARALPVSAILERRKQQLATLLSTWDEKLGTEILAENFFPDRSRDAWIKLSKETLAQAGKISATGALQPLNQLRGTFSLVGEKGRIDVFFTLTPEVPPKVQALKLTFVPAP